MCSILDSTVAFIDRLDYELRVASSPKKFPGRDAIALNQQWLPGSLSMLEVVWNWNRLSGPAGMLRVARV